ncbi:hypothetical protein I302_108371 [Kwoniella bestiolae CBS 10118]|uniref:Autophagy-related protein 27 n=1 Tax=Kwoniella bestiolae CBS 10118 TaxID=1296100 RepID=A0A1B9FVV6_9TREE|nr:hypothetical protein I302_07256 [Kwoniella bestiolae CBS 10118]OCF22906.1 hypothetical protein I302_07256 [Kwoniella bestiolae CBS 10118]
MRRTTNLLASILLLPLVTAFSCSLTASSIPYDISPLSGLREVSKDTPTPPTTSEAKVRMELCNPEGIGKQDGVADEDQCPPNTRVCLTLLNHKPSASDPDRITAVIPIWPADIPDQDVFTTPMGKKGEQGLKVYVQGADYAGVQQHLNLTLLCSQTDTAPNPTFVSYTSGLVSLEWATPDACPRSADSPSAPSEGSSGSGMGFWGFIKFVFWLSIIGLIAYFAIGIFYNHQQYSAKGWDLIPHRDFWREVPVLLQDLFSHLFAGLRGSSGGRGGYSSLG